MCRGMTSGGAKLGDKVIRFFTDTGILVLEGYGLTETCTSRHLCLHYHVLALSVYHLIRLSNG